MTKEVMEIHLAIKHKMFPEEIIKMMRRMKSINGDEQQSNEL
jgi:hypothetical protein